MGVIFGTANSVAAILMGKMIDEGRLDLNHKVVEYWSEFGANGKQNLRVVDVLRHEAGLAVLGPIEMKSLTTERILKNHVGGIIEKDYSDFKNGKSERLYHPMRDLITNEIFRRVESKGRTMGQYLKEELQPMDFDIHIGLELDKWEKSCFQRNVSICRS